MSSSTRGRRPTADADVVPVPGDGPPARRSTRPRWIVGVGVVVVLVVAAAALVALLDRPSSEVPPTAEGRPQPGSLLAAGSWWSTALPDSAPSNPDAAAVLRYLRTADQSDDGYLHLAGAGTRPWGQPFYWARPGDPTYRVRSTRFALPPELATLRIPRGAQPAATSDGAMTVVDRQRGYLVALWHASYDSGSDTWSAGGAQISYLASNGLDRRTGRSNEPRNGGTLRGNNPAVSAVRYDEVRSGAIDHVLKIAVGPESSQRHVFPMVGSDGSATSSDAPPTGLRLRIKPTVDLRDLALHGAALVIARAIQKYGVYVGDNSGVTALKLENTRVEGRGQLWRLPESALNGLPFTSQYWDVLPEGFDPSSPQGTPGS